MCRPSPLSPLPSSLSPLPSPGPPFKFDHSNGEHKNFANCVRFSPDGTTAVSVGSDKKVDER